MKITLENLAKQIQTPATFAKTLYESPIRKLWWEHKLNKILPKYISQTHKLKWKFIVRNVDRYINPMTGNVIDTNYANAQVLIKAKIPNHEWEFSPQTSTVYWISGAHKGVSIKYNSDTKTWEKPK